MHNCCCKIRLLDASEPILCCWLAVMQLELDQQPPQNGCPPALKQCGCQLQHSSCRYVLIKQLQEGCTYSLLSGTNHCKAATELTS